MTDDQAPQNSVTTVPWSAKIRPADKERLKALSESGIEAQELISKMLDNYETAKRQAEADPILREMSDVDFHLSKAKNLIQAIILQKHSEVERMQAEKDDSEKVASNARAEAHQAKEISEKAIKDMAIVIEKNRQENERISNESELLKKEAKEMRELAAFTKETAENASDKVKVLENEIVTLKKQEVLARKLEGECAALKAEKDSLAKDFSILTHEKNSLEKAMVQKGASFAELQKQNEVLTKLNIEFEKNIQHLNQKVAMSEAENEKKLWEQRRTDLEELNKLKDENVQLQKENNNRNFPKKN